MKKLILFLVLSLSLTACEQPQPQSQPVPEEDEAVEEKPKMGLVIDCQDENLFEVEKTPVKLCYPDGWQEPKMKEINTQEGKLFWLSFSNFQADGVEIWFETEDFIGTGADVSYFDFKKLNLNSDDLGKQIAEILNLSTDPVSAEKVIVSGKSAAKVELDYENDMEGKVQQIRYYIPNAFNDPFDSGEPTKKFHMTIVAPKSMEQELEKFVEKMVIPEIV